MPVATRIDTARLSLRKPEAGDFPAYRDYCASERSRFVRGPFTTSEAFDKFAAIIGHWALRGYGRYVIHLADEPVGHAGPLHLNDGEPPEITWTLWRADFEGKGIATEAAQAVAEHLLEDCGWPEMIVRVLPDNTASARIAVRLGATLTDLPAPDWYPGADTYRLTQVAQVPA